MVKGIVQGALSGLAATAPMTGAMLWGHRKLPWRERYPLPPKQITMTLAREAGIAEKLNHEEQTALTAAAHFGYGATMGAMYAVVCGRERAGALTGVLFGATVWAGSYLGLLPALGILARATSHPLRRNLLMIGAHFVWGAALGESLRAIQDEEVDADEA